MPGFQFVRRATTITVLALVALGSAGSASASSVHEISPGETLSAIAARYGFTVQELAAMNGISNPNVIYAGTQLALPGGQPATGEFAAETADGSYTVQAGDTLWSIAGAHGLTVAQLVEANRGAIANQDLIYAGQVVTIPGVGGGSGANAQPNAPASTSQSVEQIMQETAVAYGIDPALVKALAWQESGWNQSMVSSSGALGVMQVMPATGGWVATELVGRPLNVAESVQDNVLAGVVYLEWLIRYTGSEEQALAAYYQGPGSISRYGLYPETQQYVANVLAIRTFLNQHGVPPSP